MADNSHQLRCPFNKRVRGLGLRAACARVLLSFERNPGIKQEFHPEGLEIEPITRPLNADRMEEAGQVERGADRSARRASFLRLNAKSLGIVNSFRTIVKDNAEDTLKGLFTMERQTLSVLVKRIGTNLGAAREPEILHG